MSTWESHPSETSGLLFYCNPLKEVNSSKILALDLDGTIIKPEIGKIFPESIDDWVFIYNMKKIRDYSKKGYKIVIMTNQKGCYQGKGKLTFEDFKTRWTSIYEALKVPAYILAAPQDDFYRKPSSGMWDFMEKNLNGDIKINLKDCIYVGDAAGRKGDHSDVDIKFAINIGITFMTPEEFFQDSKEFQFDSLKKNLKGFDPRAYMESDLEKVHQNNQESLKEIDKIAKLGKNVLIMIGSPASGKSSLAKLISERLPKSTLILSLDLEKTKAKLKKKLINCVDKDNSECSNVIIDSTNGSKKSRQEWIEVIKKVNPDVNVFGIYLNVNKNVVMHFNELRKLRTVIDPEYHSKNIPDVAIHTFWKKFEEPTKEEGFVDIINFSFEANFKDEEDKKQFLTWF